MDRRLAHYRERAELDSADPMHMDDDDITLALDRSPGQFPPHRHLACVDDGRTICPTCTQTIKEIA